MTAPALTVSATAETRCVAGKPVIAARIANGGTETVALTVASPHGSKTIASLAAGKTTSVTFTARTTPIAAGEVTVTTKTSPSATPVSAAYSRGTTMNRPGRLCTHRGARARLTWDHV